jgi:hypothetical protein
MPMNRKRWVTTIRNVTLVASTGTRARSRLRLSPTIATGGFVLAIAATLLLSHAWMSEVTSNSTETPAIATAKQGQGGNSPQEPLALLDTTVRSDLRQEVQLVQNPEVQRALQDLRRQPTTAPRESVLAILLLVSILVYLFYSLK